MERENYYIILDLSVDPPENDQEIIKKAIQNKKVEWSRLRNHPTKGLQVQKFINMIPDIENVMLDESAREQEAAAAAEFLEAGRENKISEIDGHIDILMGKGYIGKEDIIRLAEIHGLSQNEINDRIAAKQDGVYSRIDQLIGLRMGKGYILEAELARIAKKHSMDADEIRKRIRCPVIKDEKEAENLAIRPLDKSIEKSINDNLKIVVKKSLYDFLGVKENAELAQLQEKAGKKKKSLSNLGKKDAVVTAGLTLAGQCLTIFKTNETRIAYDVSLAQAKLASLDSDINVAAINKKIRYEYFDALVSRAIEFGMDREEAAAYIRAFCQKKKYRIEKKPEKNLRRPIVAAAAVVLILVVIAGYFGFSRIHHQKVLKSEYQQVIKQVDAQPAADQKIRLLKKYITTHDANEYSADAQNRISQIETRVSTEKFNNILQAAEELIETKDLDNALVFLNRQIEKAGDADQKKAIQQKINQVSTQIEKRDYAELTTVSLSGDPDQKIEIFQKYLKNHPNGKNREQVQALIDEISNEYFIYVRKMLSVYAKQEKWEDCIRLCQSYIEIYDNSHSDQLKQLLPEYQDNLRDEKIFKNLVEKADQLAPRYQAAVGIYQEYLAAYPESSVADKVKKEINRLNKKISVQNAERAANALRLQLAATGGRFVEKHSGVISDTRTGLMWSMLDSDATMTGTCLTYEQGQEYVASLTAGGFTDWRLPTPDELRGILKTSPAYPVNGKKSYWTSDSYSGYSDGWEIQVTTVSSPDATHWETVRRNAVECGTAWAVRKP